MNVLIIDCSGGMRLTIKTSTDQFNYIDEQSKKQSDSLIEKIDNLLASAKLDIKDIDVLAVNVGPGSFTGIRVALSTAKGLCIGTNAKLIIFNSFEAYFSNIQSRNFGIILDGFGNNFYYYFKKYGKIFQGCATTDKLAVLAKDIDVYSPSSAVIEQIPQWNIKQIDYAAAVCVMDKIENEQYIQTNQVTPLYLRASQAEIQRMNNGNKI